MSSKKLVELLLILILNQEYFFCLPVSDNFAKIYLSCLKCPVLPNPLTFFSVKKFFPSDMDYRGHTDSCSNFIFFKWYQQRLRGILFLELIPKSGIWRNRWQNLVSIFPKVVRASYEFFCSSFYLLLFHTIPLNVHHWYHWFQLFKELSEFWRQFIFTKINEILTNLFVRHLSQFYGENLAIGNLFQCLASCRQFDRKLLPNLTYFYWFAKNLLPPYLALQFIAKIERNSFIIYSPIVSFYLQVCLIEYRRENFWQFQLQSHFQIVRQINPCRVLLLLLHWWLKLSSIL